MPPYKYIHILCHGCASRCCRLLGASANRRRARSLTNMRQPGRCTFRLLSCRRKPYSRGLENSFELAGALHPLYCKPCLHRCSHLGVGTASFAFSRFRKFCSTGQLW